LQIYRPMLTMLMSIAHRVTGAALYFGTVLIVWRLRAPTITPPCNGSWAA
jgi:succinate dehydrogenase / fumarate reductase cytochrome b subunit